MSWHFPSWIPDLVVHKSSGGEDPRKSPSKPVSEVTAPRTISPLTSILINIYVADGVMTLSVLDS